MYLRSKIAYGFLLNLVLVFTVVVSSVLAEPADPFLGASPAFEPPKEASVDYNVGDWGVAEQRGAATYTFPIAVPMGRQGMAPRLALRYSSQAPLRGGLAVGWTLDLPSIGLDPSLGYQEEPVYRASLGAASGRLVEVPDVSPYPGAVAYRVEFDDSYTRFFRIPVSGSLSSWVALTADGVRHHFEYERGATDGQRRWHVTRQVDPFGNTVRYRWGFVYAPSDGRRIIDYSLRRIEYSLNEGAGLAPHARVDFEYAPLERCADSDIPIGAAPSPSHPLTVEGALRLTAVTTSVRDQPEAEWRLTRRYALNYAMRASVLHYPVLAPPEPANGLPCTQIPLRYLTEIAVTAYDAGGNTTTLPPVTFAYNNRGQGPGLPELPFGPRERERTIPGVGYGHYGTRHGGVGALLDLDSDGVRDRVAVVEENGICTMIWHKGLPGGAFDAAERKSRLPTAPWLDGDQPRESLERCTLNGQIAYRPRQVIGGTMIEKGILSYHFMDYTGDGRIDLLTNVWAAIDHASYEPPSSIGANSRPVPQQPQAGPVAPVAEPTPIPPLPLTPEREGNSYVWRVYRNAGDPASITLDPAARFSRVFMKVRSPFVNQNRSFPPSLPPSAGDELLDDSVLPNASIPTLTDLDGDGFMDFVDVGTHPNLLGSDDDGAWSVYFGNGGPEFGPERQWQIPKITLSLGGRGYNEEVTDEDGVRHIRRTTVAALHDINGDGLPDLVAQTSDLWLKVYLNFGQGFRTQPVFLGLAVPVEEVQTDYLSTTGSVVLVGNRGYRRRLVDVDGDRLLDMITFPGAGDDITQAQEPTVHFNTGDRFMSRVTVPLVWARAKRLFHAEDPDWWVDTDLVDVTGDGLADLATWSEDGTLTVFESPGLQSAPDLLSAVENGRGLRVEFSYASSTDPAAVRWRHGSSSAHLPYPMWVVNAVTVSGGHGTPEMVTRYTYDDPAFRSPAEYTGISERHRLMGFLKTTPATHTTADKLARQVTRRYAYGAMGAPDGRVVQEWVYRAEDSALRLHSYKEITWTREALFDGRLFVTHPGLSLTRICAPGATASACEAQIENVRRVQETWVPVCPSQVASGLVAARCTTAPAELYVRTARQEGSGLTQGQEDRRREFAYQIRYGQSSFAADDYRILTAQTTLWEARLDGSTLGFQQRGKTETTYDRATGLPVQTTHSLDENTAARTNRTFDPATGNLLSVTKPNQAAPGGSGKRTTYAYDPHALYVQETVNELGHQVRTTRDVATGALLERAGPNAITLASDEVVWERETWQIDGLGRVLTHSISLDDAAQGYALHVVNKVTYFDTEQPYRVREERRRDFEADVWITSERALDGLGRPLTDTLYLEGDVNAVTTYQYDGDSNLTALEVPDPQTDTGARVRYTYTYDGLGRLTGITHPDGNGVSYTYAGLVKTVRETTGDGSGATKTLRDDVFGRLVEVREHLSTDQEAVTRYRYDGRDNLTQIQDAEGNVTTLSHDWVDNRLSITRGDRSWRYRYDLNGNVVAAVSPAPPGADPSDYTVVHTYDDLDRVTAVSYRDLRVAELPAPGHTFYLPLVLSDDAVREAEAPNGGPDAQTALSATAPDPITATLQYVYDQGPNRIGRLHQVALPFGVVEYAYDARGLIAAEQRSLVLHDVATLSVTQQVQREYNALGQLTLSTWDDGQQWRINYDLRGLVATVEWLDPSAGVFLNVADYDRSIAGPPRVRASSFGQTRRFTYDALGRVDRDSVFAAGREAPVATREYAYTDSGDLARVAGATDGVSADATYTYDALHRLTAAAGPHGYAGAFTYSPTGNIRTANITWDGSAETRQVRYEYGDVDPQAVDQLVDAGSDTGYARFQYDPSGNMTQRVTPQGTTGLVWDGRDQLRLAHGPDGAELYLYDFDGQRMLAISEADGVRFWFAESETHFALDGTQTRRYLHLSAGGTTLARVEDGTRIELQYADALNNLMLALDGAGNTVARFFYGAFGEVVHATGAEGHRRQFNGKEHDALTGLRYYGFRYYDPLLLRWNSADPLYGVVPELGLAAPQHINLYSFSLNNPLRYYDPDGRAVNTGQGPFSPFDPNPQGGPYCLPESFGKWCNSGPSEESDDASSQQDDDGPVEITEQEIDYAFLEDLTLFKLTNTLGKAVLKGEACAEEQCAMSGEAGVSFTALESEAEVSCDGGSCKAGGSIKGGVAEGEAVGCFIFVCAGVSGSLGPQVGAEASVGKETSVKLRPGIFSVGVKLRFRMPKVECRGHCSDYYTDEQGNITGYTTTGPVGTREYHPLRDGTSGFIPEW